VTRHQVRGEKPKPGIFDFAAQQNAVRVLLFQGKGLVFILFSSAESAV